MAAAARFDPAAPFPAPTRVAPAGRPSMPTQATALGPTRQLLQGPDEQQGGVAQELLPMRSSATYLQQLYIKNFALVRVRPDLLLWAALPCPTVIAAMWGGWVGGDVITISDNAWNCHIRYQIASYRYLILFLHDSRETPETAVSLLHQKRLGSGTEPTKEKIKLLK